MLPRLALALWGCLLWTLSSLTFAVALSKSPEISPIPDQGGYRYFVGTSDLHSNLNRALIQAWEQALVAIAYTQFPQLYTMKQRSKETLEGSEFESEKKLLMDRINWMGLEEDPSRPYVVEQVRKDEQITYKATRVLRWKIADIQNESRRLKTMADKSIAITPNRYDLSLGDTGLPLGTLSVTTDPPGAQILLNGRSLGVSNAEIQNLPTGLYQLDIQLEGYAPIQRKSVAVVAGRANVEKAKLIRLMGAVELITDPAGAQVYLDGVLRGQTPLLMQAPYGDHNVRLEKEDFHSQSNALKFYTGKTTKMLRMSRKSGKISVLSTPSGALVWVDGRDVGRTPLIERELAGGPRSIRITLNGFDSISREVDIRSSHTDVVNVVMKQLDGKFMLSKTPKTTTGDSAPPSSKFWDSIQNKPYIGIYYTYYSPLIDSKHVDNGIASGGLMLGARLFSIFGIEGRISSGKVEEEYANGKLEVTKREYGAYASVCLYCVKTVKFFVLAGAEQHQYQIGFDPSGKQAQLQDDTSLKERDAFDIQGKVIELGCAVPYFRLTVGQFMPQQKAIKGYALLEPNYLTLSINTPI